MKINDVMTRNVIKIAPEESVAVAARTLAGSNVGILPVCDRRGRVCGLVTDRDLVTRCMASDRAPAKTQVSDVMTRQVTAANPDMEVSAAARIMGRLQVRRLPVVENGILCGMVSLADLARNQDCVPDAAQALTDISGNLSAR